MSSFPPITSTLVPLPVNDIDTDQIIPARFLKATDKLGLGEHLFADWRYRPDGSLNPGFNLNRPEYSGGKVLLAGDNFGCGSSREHAPWALVAYGFRAVISTSFADIFQNNALKNGLLPVRLSPGACAALLVMVNAKPEAQITVDLVERSVVFPDATVHFFPVDPFARHCLLNGVDELGYLLQFEEKIAAFEHNRQEPA